MNFNQKKFVSADPLFAEVREELSSYFNTGAVDDMMFPKYLNDALKTLRNSANPIKQTAIVIKNNSGTLPDDFDSVREAWACRNVIYEYPNPTSYYYPTDCRLDDISDPCHICNKEKCDDCDPCNKQYMVVHKYTGTHMVSYAFSHPLKPGNLAARKMCNETCLNLYVESPDTFDIAGCEFMTSFREGVVHLVYYANGMDEDDEQLVPDDYWVQDYIMKYLKYKIFQKLYNMATDESFNQSRVKFQEAEQAKIEAYVVAQTELKKDTTRKSKLRTKRTQNRLNGYYKMLGY